MRNKIQLADPDIVGSWPALLRAARRAMRIAKATHTPLYVMKNGRVVSINPNAKRRKGRSAGSSTPTEKVSAILTEDVLEAPAKKARKGGLKRVLDEAANRPPVEGDEIG